VIGVWAVAWQNAANLDIKGMPFVGISGLGLTAQSFGDLLAGPHELSLRRSPGLFGKLIRVYLAHGSVGDDACRSEPVF
jgi:hypothetical protein